MIDISEWTKRGWTTQEDGTGGFFISHISETVCGRCGQQGPWTLRALPNGELAHRDYAVCRCGELMHVEAIWPTASIPIPR